jgi:hypothetical protein
MHSPSSWHDEAVPKESAMAMNYHPFKETRIMKPQSKCISTYSVLQVSAQKSHVWMDFWEVAPNKKLFSLPVAHGFEAYKSIRDLNLRTTLLKLERCTALLWTLLLSLYMGASISAYISMKQNNVFPSSFSYSASFYFLWAGLLYQILQRRGCFLWFKKKVPQGEMLVIN